MQGSALQRKLFVVLPAVVSLCAYARLTQEHAFAVDFVHEYSMAVWRVQHGLNPYNPASVGFPAAPVGRALPFTATAVGLLVAWPFALLPQGASAVAFALFTAACAVAALMVLQVGDRRLYGLAIVWAPVMSAWGNANLTLVAVLCVASVWRHRDRPLVAGVLTAVAVSLKPFVWPIGLWLLATRRYRAAAGSLALALALNAVGFGLLGPRSLPAFLHISRMLSARMLPGSYGPAGLAAHLGAGSAGYLISCVAAGALGGWALWQGRRGQELRALTATCAIMLLASPIVWLHYLSVLLVPLAIARPRLDWLWFAPLLLWLVPVADPNSVENLTVIAVWAAVLVLATGRGALSPVLGALVTRLPSMRLLRPIAAAAGCRADVTRAP